MRFYKALALSLLTIFVLSPMNIFACACCAESGTYYVTTSKPSDYELEILSEMKFGRNPSLYLDTAGFENIKGLASIRKVDEAEPPEGEGFSVYDADYFSLENQFAAKTWTFNFKTKDGQEGRLTLPMPDQMESFGADIHDGRSGGAGGPLLYKELRFKGRVGSGTGLFKDDITADTRFFLVFQGRGNNCTNAQDFTHWRLSIEGEKADYDLHGMMSSGNPDYFFDEKGNAQADAPTFEQYKVQVSYAKPKPVNLNSHEDARMFRTRLREAANEGVNFAGHYIFTSWGCGTGCQVGAIIDANTGTVYFPKEMAGMGFGVSGAEVADEPMQFRRYSTLFILSGYAADGEGEGVTYLVWEGTKFRQIMFVKSEGGFDSTGVGPGGESNYLITNESAGDIRIGMTISDAQKILPGAKFSRGPGEGEDVIDVVKDGMTVLWFTAAEGGDDYEAPIKGDTKITGIVIFDSSYKTADGIHTKMTISDAEAKYGKLKEIWLEGLTGDEYATFSNHPKGIRISVGRQGDEWGLFDLAGVYKKDEDKTAKYVPGAVIKTITVSGGDW